jgi:hypothetical protein
MDRHQLEHLSPPDAVVALRSYVRRFGEVLRPADLEGDLPLTLVVHRGWSVRDLLAATADRLDRLDDAMRRTLDEERPVLPAGLFDRPGEPPAAGHTGGDAAADTARLLDAVCSAFERSAERTARTPSKDWSRPVVIGTATTTAHELLRESVAYGRTALDELAATVDAARRAPTT